MWEIGTEEGASNGSAEACPPDVGELGLKEGQDEFEIEAVDEGLLLCIFAVCLGFVR